MARPFGTKNMTPEQLEQYFNDYEQWVKLNPIKVHDFVGKDAEEVYRLKERPLTYVGFERWCYDKGIITDISDYFENKDNRYLDYVHISRAIKRKIANDQITGGLVGIYNQSITARLNNLVEKSETKTELNGVDEIIIKRKVDN